MAHNHVTEPHVGIELILSPGQVGVEAPQECRVRPHVDCALIPSGQSRLPGPAMRCADREQAANIEPLAGDLARAGGMTGHQSPH